MLLNDADVCFERGNSKLALRSALTASPNAIIITHGGPILLGSEVTIINPRKRV